MIGEHTVTLFRDASAPVPLNTNPYMTSNVFGWQAAPFEDAVTWATDGWLVQARGGTVGRSQTDANPTARPSGDRLYLVRVRWSQPVTATAKFGLFFGTTVENAWRGPFWAGAANAGSWETPNLSYPAGTYTYTAQFSVPATWHPEFVYVAPFLSKPYRADASAGPDRVDSVEMFGWVASDVVDVSCLVDDVTIRHGRSDTTSQPEPTAATINLAWDGSVDSLPAVAEVGATVEVATNLPGAVRTRFRGRITDIAAGWDEAGAVTPYNQQAQIAAVGSLADLGRRVIGAEPWPVENDAQRVSRVANLAGMPLDPWVSDPGTVQIRARDVDSQPALSVMRETAVSGQGIVWQTKTGEIRYSDSAHRTRVAVGLEMDACDVLVSPTWVRNLDGLTNEVAIGYGAGDGGSQPRYTATNPSSQTKWGRYAYTTDTLLSALADAAAMGDLLMRRNYEPVWVLSAIPVDVAGLDAADTDRLLGLDLNDLVHLTGLPAIGTAPTDIYGWVEGWTETLADGVHDMALALSAYCRTAGLVRWDDPTTTTWNTIPDKATRTWDQSFCLGYPGPGIGRWDDTPTSLRWDQVASNVTWDTWVQPTTMDEAA